MAAVMTFPLRGVASDQKSAGITEDVSFLAERVSKTIIFHTAGRDPGHPTIPYKIINRLQLFLATTTKN